MPRQPALPVPLALKALLGSAGRAKLLAHFLLHPGEAFHTRELARLLDGSPGSLLRDLRRLETIRLLHVNRVGNLRGLLTSENEWAYNIAYNAMLLAGRAVMFSE